MWSRLSSLITGSQRQPQARGAPSPNPDSTPASITLRRRTLENRRRLQQQLSSGRPEAPWRLCGDSLCQLRHCAATDSPPGYHLLDRERSRLGSRMQDLTAHFAAQMATLIWRSSWWGMGPMLAKIHAVSSFLASPPVRRAYVEFKTALEVRGIILPKWGLFAESLHSTILPQFHAVLMTMQGGLDQEVRDMIHLVLDDKDPNRAAWTADDYILQLLLKMELWRTQDAGQLRKRQWDFGTPRVVAELLVALVLHFRWMDAEAQCFDVAACAGPAEHDEVWQAWIDRFPPSALDDGSNHDVRAARGCQFAPRMEGDVGWDVGKGVGDDHHIPDPSAPRSIPSPSLSGRVPLQAEKPKLTPPSPKPSSPLSVLTIGITALLLTGYASKFRYHLSTKQSLQGQSSPPTSSTASQNRALAMEIDKEARQREQQRRLRQRDKEAEAAAAVEDAYGDRSSLDDLERAVEAYSRR
ncbi:hypothetical protein ESCO_001977 [Escovopsis weberi]|uniref:Uncharacterized protein n=1 Tax=Escovopsis weberi TaxID=150374 RepID=A0A0M8N7Y1_ESCWE|nr:hypothetical protein ESCO_001977 [Escovopsis weberi]